jgi:hypothetical protein
VENADMKQLDQADEVQGDPHRYYPANADQLGSHGVAAVSAVRLSILRMAEN